MSKLKKNALITGAGSGIGAEVSIALAKNIIQLLLENHYLASKD